jgi:rhodanese-related sulfurtransferase
MTVRSLSAPELAAWLADPARPAPTVLDVREAWEVATAALPGATAIPMGQITTRTEELDGDGPIVCLCHHGMRSMQVAGYLERRGFTDVWNLTGGIDAWSRQVDPSVPTY